MGSLKPTGNLNGLKSAQLDALQRIFRRRVDPGLVTTSELAQTLCRFSADTNRQVGVFINRRGEITEVIVGDTERLELPDVGRKRAGASRLRGTRLVHTHVKGEGITQDDLTDLSLLSFDCMMALTITDDGRPDQAHMAHVLPENPEGRLWEVLDPVPFHDFHLDFGELVRSLEKEFSRTSGTRKNLDGDDRAIVVHIDHRNSDSELDLAETLELCATAGVTVVDVLSQSRRRMHPKTVVGKGTLKELMIRSMQLEVELLIFSQDLNPPQCRAVTDACELKVLDRTQLILDIFAQRAKSRDGKLQVELAQLQYMLPRLMTRNTGMSRLSGGIGGRGPGETKLEINRRRAKDRIQLLGKRLNQLCKNRSTQRGRRSRSNVPVVSIVGYTNAGKSTLLNTLTQSKVLAEDKLFATLDTSSRRLRFPEDREVVITDTVGFIRDLPDALIAAFKATLEELEYADLLLHVADISNPNVIEQIESVNGILKQLNLDEIPALIVFNKIDQADPEQVQNLCERYGAIGVSALERSTTRVLYQRIQQELLQEKPVKEPTYEKWSPI